MPSAKSICKIGLQSSAALSKSNRTEVRPFSVGFYYYLQNGVLLRRSQTKLVLLLRVLVCLVSSDNPLFSTEFPHFVHNPKSLQRGHRPPCYMRNHKSSNPFAIHDNPIRNKLFSFCHRNTPSYTSPYLSPSLVCNFLAVSESALVVRCCGGV